MDSQDQQSIIARQHEIITRLRAMVAVLKECLLDLLSDPTDPQALAQVQYRLAQVEKLEQELARDYPP
jgi:hypothetical protein